MLWIQRNILSGKCLYARKEMEGDQQNIVILIDVPITTDNLIMCLTKRKGKKVQDRPVKYSEYSMNPTLYLNGESAALSLLTFL